MEAYSKNDKYFRIKQIVAGVFILGLIYWFQSRPVEIPQESVQRIRNLSPGLVHNLIIQNEGRKEFVVLDVRTQEEYGLGHLEGSKLLDFYRKDFSEQLSSLDRSGTYVLYCRSGNRSGKVLAQMKQLGFKEVYHIKGGYLAWKESGY